MKPFKINVFICLVLFMPLYAYSWDSLYLLEKCKEHINFTELAKINNKITSLDDPLFKAVANGNLCSGYIRGFLDSYTYYIQAPKYCIPEPVDTYQIAKVYTKYLDDHPEKMHLSASFTFSEALIEYFPCNN